MNAFITHAIALGITGALAVGTAAPSSAAPVVTATAAVKSMAGDAATPVRRRGRGIGLAAGLAVGAIAGAAIANATRPYYGPAYPYAYDVPAYEGPIYAEPAPVYGYRGYYGCVSYEGYGRTTSCDGR